MTQALNLANFANKLNTSGATDNTGLQNSSVTVTAGTGMSGGGAVALGSSVTLTNAGVTSVTGGTGISVSASTGGVTITNTNVTTYVGDRAQVFTSSGTFSVPAGVTAVKVTLIGGSGGINFVYNNATAGGTSSFGSYFSATGGAPTSGGGGCCNPPNYGAGGTGVGAMFNFIGTIGSAGGNFALPNAIGWRNAFGSYGTPNSTLGSYSVNGATGGYGGIGISWITGLTSGGTVAVTIGLGGSQGSSYYSLQATGSNGLCLVEW
jgi:hypothetical protein